MRRLASRSGARSPRDSSCRDAESTSVAPNPIRSAVMSFLAPLYLLLAGAIAVSLLIHLMRRRIGARVEFPAARYLERAEKEHSRTLRIRNLLLMFLRVLALIAIAAAAAHPVARWLGAGHAPTAIAI